MNLIDLLLLLIASVSVIAGWRKGFIAGFLDLAGWIVSLLAGLFLYRPLSEFIEKNVTTVLGVWTVPIAFLLIILLVRVLYSVIVYRLLRTTPAETHRHIANRMLGLVPGFINGLINATIVAALLLALPISEGITARTRDSAIATRLASEVEWLDDKLSPVFDEAVNHSINKLTVHPESNSSVKLPFTEHDAEIRTDLEATMLQMVNEERTKEGLPSLMADPELSEVARAHSRDMFARGYFAHVTPEGKAPGDRIRAAGVRFMIAGENLALGQTLKICHKGLMNSPGHRANILNTSYGRLGIGILDGGIHGLMITQNFRN